MHSLASPLTTPYAGGVAGALPGLGGFALGQAAPGLRGLTTPGLALATVLLVSNLNEEVSFLFWKIIFRREIAFILFKNHRFLSFGFVFYDHLSFVVNNVEQYIFREYSLVVS